MNSDPLLTIHYSLFIGTYVTSLIRLYLYLYPLSFFVGIGHGQLDLVEDVADAAQEAGVGAGADGGVFGEIEGCFHKAIAEKHSRLEAFGE